MRLVTTEIEAAYSVKVPFRLPYHSGGMFHGLFGRALRTVACPEVPCCEGPCARSQPPEAAGESSGSGECTWRRLFSPPPRVPAPHRLLVGQKEPPGPVVLRIPPPGGEEMLVGKTLSLGLRLFGETDGDVAALEKALTRMAELPFAEDGGRVALRSITRYSPQDVAANVGSVAPSESSPAEVEGARITRVAVRFETPARIKRAGDVTTEIDFATLFMQVWRRLTLLSALYGEYGDADDATFQRLRALATAVKTVEKRLVPLSWEHLSAETGERKRMRGVIGHLVFEGPSLGALVPALMAGEAVHAGGGTSFGLGRLSVNVVQ